jgi:muramoyltetrapeptide carboxypeptidase
MKPPALKPGDTIGVMAPSSYVEKQDIEKSKALLEKKGYKVFIHPQTYERHNQSAGTNLQKTLALQGLWQRPDINAIWAAGGGNRVLHFMDTINFEALKKKPKIFIGFSDVTALLNGIYAHTSLTTFHGPVFKEIHKSEPKQITQTLDLMAGEKTVYELSKTKTFREGKAEGKLIGGNLSLFHYLPGTLPGKFWKNALLFLEDCGDEMSRFDRMFVHLRRLGVLKEIKGLIIGDFSVTKDSGRPYGFSLEDILLEHTEGLDIPVITNAPFGHGKTLYTFPIGVKASLDTKARKMTLLEKAVKQ